MPSAEPAAIRTLGDTTDTFAILNNLAATYFYQCDYLHAAEVITQLLEGQRRALGAEHPSVLMVMNNLAATEQVLNHFDRAESLFGELINLRRRALGPEHPNTLDSIHGLAIVYERQGKYPESEAKT